MGRNSSTPEYFWSRYKRVGKCLIFQGATVYGYGTLTYGNKTWRAHRLAWVLKKGPIPQGKDVLHSCDVKCCGEVDHLFIGTQQINMDDKCQKGRQARGEKNGTAKLRVHQVKRIRKLRALGLSAPKIAREFHITKQQVYHIAKRRQWTHI